MGVDKLLMKKNFKPTAKLEPFYSGGPAKLNHSGNLVACACGEEVKVVDVASGVVKTTCPGDGGAITCLCFTPDDSFLFIISKCQILKKWDLEEGECTRAWKVHKAPVLDITVDPKGFIFATGGADRTVNIWSVEGGFCTHTFKGHSGVVFKILFHPKKPLLLSAGDDSDIRIWDLEKKHSSKVLKGHMSAVTSLSFSQNGDNILVSGGRDKVVIVWDIQKQLQLATVPVFESIEGVACLPFELSRRGAGEKPLIVFATGGERGNVKIWRSDTGEVVTRQESEGGAYPGGEIMHLESNFHNGCGLMTAMADNTIALWDCKVTGETAAIYRERLLVGDNDEITDLEWVGPPEEPTHICVATNSAHLRLFDVASMNCVTTLTGHSDAVLCTASCSLENGCTLLVSGSKDNAIRVWEAPSGVLIATGKEHSAAVSSVALSNKKDKFIVTSSADGMVKLWDLASILLAKNKSSNEEKAPALKVINGALVHSKDVNTVAISPTDSHICTGSQDKTVKVFRVPDLVLEMTLLGHRRGVWSVQFSPVDTTLITSSGDKTIKLWSLSDGSCLRTFEGHSEAVLKAVFVTNGLQVLSCGGDALVKLWDAHSTECINTFDEHEDRIWTIKTSGVKEARLMTGGSDSVLTIWKDTTTEDEELEASKRAEETIKEQELSNALKAKDYSAASKLAFQLQQPKSLLNILKRTTPGDTSTRKVLLALVEKLDQEGIKKCLEYVRDWNTNSRNCHEAQHLLRAILETITPEYLVNIPGIGSLLDGLHAYSLRHLSRINRITQSTFLVDYTLSSMNVLVPENYGDNPSELDLQNKDRLGKERNPPTYDVSVGKGIQSASSDEESGGAGYNKQGTMIKQPLAQSSASSDLVELSTDGEGNTLYDTQEYSRKKLCGRKRRVDHLES